MKNSSPPHLISALWAFLFLGSAHLQAWATAAPWSAKGLMGEAQFTVLSLAEREDHPLAGSVGSLMFVFDIPDEDFPAESSTLRSEPFMQSICTAVQIGPRHVLTASHCDHPQLSFSKWRIARDQDRELFEFLTWGPVVRLVFKGDFVPPFYRETNRSKVKRTLMKNSQLDYALLELETELPGPYLPLASDSPGDTSTLHLLGHPHGMPLTLAWNCHRQGNGKTASQSPELSKDRSPFFYHDCDSLEGSSGGLLFSPQTMTPVGLHLQGPLANDASFYLAHRRFETPREFARRRNCRYESKGSNEGSTRSPREGEGRFCPMPWIFNKGLFLYAIRQDLMDRKNEWPIDPPIPLE